MKKFFSMVFAAALFVSCGDASDEASTKNNNSDDSAISKIEAEMGLTICDCLPQNMPMPDFSTASKEVREKYQKGPDEIGPREFKSYINKDLPIYMIVIPAGKQRDGDQSIQYFHIIVEDLEVGECNGSYELLTETELENKHNIIYFN